MPGPVPATSPGTWCELVLVACRDGVLAHLTGPGRWWVACDGADHPNQVALAALLARLGGGDDLPGLVLHSTSWRYEAETGALVLTYLAALPVELAEAATARGFVAEPVGGAMLVHGDRLHPPERIEPPHVLAHALDHLALLVRNDPAVAAALGQGWHRALAERSPGPSGHLGTGSHLTARPAVGAATSASRPPDRPAAG